MDQKTGLIFMCVLLVIVLVIVLVMFVLLLAMGVYSWSEAAEMSEIFQAFF